MNVQVELADVTEIPVKDLDVAADEEGRVQVCRRNRGRKERERDAPVNQLKRDQLVVLLSNPSNEEKRGITAVDDLGVCAKFSVLQSAREEEEEEEREGGRRTFVLEKVAHACSSGEDELRYVFDDFGCGRREGQREGTREGESW